MASCVAARRVELLTHCSAPSKPPWNADAIITVVINSKCTVGKAEPGFVFWNTYIYVANGLLQANLPSVHFGNLRTCRVRNRK